MFGRLGTVWETRECLGNYGMFGKLGSVWETRECLGD